MTQVKRSTMNYGRRSLPIKSSSWSSAHFMVVVGIILAIVVVVNVFTSPVAEAPNEKFKLDLPLQQDEQLDEEKEGHVLSAQDVQMEQDVKLEQIVKPKMEEQQTNLRLPKRNTHTQPIDTTNREQIMYSHYHKGKAGVVIEDMLMAHAYAFHRGATYGGSCGEPSKEHHELQVSLLESIGLKKALPFECPNEHNGDKSARMSMISRETYRKDDTRTWTPDYVDYVKSLVSYPEKETEQFTIAVHIRRSDVTPCRPENKGYQRYLPNLHYQLLIDKHMQPNARVIIFSQSESFEPFDDFINKGYEVKLDGAVTDVWQTIATADVVILSRSSFSFVPAMVSKGIVV
jgi:hypothetical protein